MVDSDEYYYFAFGSNLKQRRLQLGSPRAQLSSRATLHDYQLVFQGKSQFWHGATASIQPRVGSIVHGALWKLHPEELGNLDHQEGVHLGLYRRIALNVITPDGKNVQCISYQRTESQHDRPSPQYLQVIVEGACELGLPNDYIEQLRAIKHNGSKGEVHLSSEYIVNGSIP